MLNSDIKLSDVIEERAQLLTLSTLLDRYGKADAIKLADGMKFDDEMDKAQWLVKQDAKNRTLSLRLASAYFQVVESEKG